MSVRGHGLTPHGQPIVAIVYARYSTDIQDPTSAEDQIADGRRSVAKHGGTVFADDRDDAKRGTALRVGWDRVKGRAMRHEGGTNTIWVEAVGRFTRRFLRGWREINDLHDAGVFLMDDTGVVDPDTTEGQARLYTGLARASGELEDDRKRAQRNKRNAVHRHKSIGGTTNVGLRPDPVMGKDKYGNPVRLSVLWAPDPVWAPLVLRMFEAADEGRSGRSIAATLNDEGLRTPKGRLWSGETVLDVLRNPIYIGTKEYNRTTREGPYDENIISEVGFCPAIVPTDLFERVQARLAKVRATYDACHAARAGRNRSPLSGRCRCSCGGSMVSSGRGYLECDRRKRMGRRACQHAFRLRYSALEARVRDLLGEGACNPERWAALVEEHNRKIDDTNASLGAELRALETRLAQLEAEQERLVMLARTGVQEIPVVAAALRSNGEEVTALAKKVETTRSQIAPRLAPHVPVSGRMKVPFEKAVEESIDKIDITADGAIVVRFLVGGLLMPVAAQAGSATYRPGSPVVRESSDARARRRPAIELGLDRGITMPRSEH